MKRYSNKSYVFVYHPTFRSDLAQLDEKTKKKIQSFVWLKLSLFPAHCGTPLRPSLNGHRKAMIGEYLMVYRIQNRAILITTIQPYSAIK